MKRILLFMALSGFNLATFAQQSCSKPIFFTSFPKTGSTLMAKLLVLLMPYMQSTKVFETKTVEVSPDMFDFPHRSVDDLWLIKPEHIYYSCSREAIQHHHWPATENNIKILAGFDRPKGFFIIRDPRDTLISLFFFIRKFPEEELWTNFHRNASDNDLITELLNNFSNVVIGPSYAQWKTFVQAYTQFLPWQNQPWVYTTRFEWLVGSKGGGSDSLQLREIKNIASHLEIKLTDIQAKEIANQLFGGTWNFREGQIGSWKKHLNQKHKEIFKAQAGNLLVNLGYEKNALN